MSDTSISTARTAWNPPNAREVEGATVQELRTSLQAETDRGNARYEDSLRRYNELVAPQLKRDRAENVRAVWGMNGIAVAVGALGIGLGMAVAGARGAGLPTIGTSIPRNFLRGAGMGALGTGAFTGVVTGWIGAMTHGDFLNSSPDQKQKWSEATTKALADRNANRSRHVPYFELERATEWKPGAVDDTLAAVAAFDHDGNGAIDLAASSPELRRDARGGPVSPSTEDIRALPKLMRDADANHDGQLVPEEAIRAAVTAEIMGT